jgi:hypothetical protein
MNENIKGFLEGTKVGAKQSHKNMTLYCLLSAQVADVDWVTLDGSVDNRFLSVNDLDSSAGSIRRICSVTHLLG